jgi:hypothetical protein
MAPNTDSLIQDLAGTIRPVRPLLRPEMRAIAWLVFAVAVVVAVMAVHGIDSAELGKALSDPRLIAEEVATVVTAVSAAIVAFRSTVPGTDRRWSWVPFAGLGAWVLFTGAGCAADYGRLGPAGLSLSLDTNCFVPGAIAGALLTVAVVLMLKRGAPLVPRLTLIYAGMAIAATVNFGLLVLHEGDVSIMLLVWHTGLVLALAAIGGWVAPALLSWPRRVVAR